MARPLLVSLIVATAASAAVPASNATQIAWLSNGKLVTKPAGDGTARPATPAEIASWKAAGNAADPVAPGGKFWVDGEGEHWRVRRVSDGKLQASETRLKAALQGTFAYGQMPVFGGWLSDGRHLVLVHSDANTHCEYRVRCILDMETGRMERFNGWLAPDSRTALVSNVDGRVEERTVYDGPYHGGKPSGPSRLTYAIASLDGAVSNYRFTAGESKPLRLNGKPFALDPAESSVQFSEDGHWALCSGGASGTFLISLTTGAVSPIAGKRVQFLRAAAPRPELPASIEVKAVNMDAHEDRERLLLDPYGLNRINLAVTNRGAVPAVVQFVAIRAKLGGSAERFERVKANPQEGGSREVVWVPNGKTADLGPFTFACSYQVKVWRPVEGIVRVCGPSGGALTCKFWIKADPKSE